MGYHPSTAFNQGRKNAPKAISQFIKSSFDTRQAFYFFLIFVCCDIPAVLHVLFRQGASVHDAMQKLLFTVAERTTPQIYILISGLRIRLASPTNGTVGFYT